ncbi:MAG: hydrogenase nickel incorporation protein HypB [Thermoanaerobaculaceae bacterium]|jgi:hydrogenase nickel incorporation protein HypB
MAEVVDVRARVLAANEQAAAKLRDGFRAGSALVLNLISSPGSGKTTLLEATVKALAGRLRLAGIEGDIATERDADRLRALGIPAVQILTGGACHLDARQIGKAMDEARFPVFDVLFIENVGNLICPTTYDLGEDFKVALLSVAEGDDKPFKYPAIFARAAVTVVTKSDLLPHVTFDVEAVHAQVAALNPGGRLLVTSSKTGEGIGAWCALIEERLAAKRKVKG